MPERTDTTSAALSAAVDVVVVSFNTRDYLARCLSTLGSHRAIVVDNASTDGSVALVRNRFDATEVVSVSRNRGFGAAANEGLRRVRTRYALLLNADAWPQPEAVGNLVAAADCDERSGVVAPRLLNEDGSEQRSVFGYPGNAVSLATWVLAPGPVSTAFRTWRGLTGLLRRPKTERLESITGSDFPAGAALLIRMEAFEEVGGFDEAFFMYSEETDLCHRLRRLGWRIRFAPDSVFVHAGGASTAQAPELNQREQLRSYLRFLAKHDSTAEARRALRMLVWAFRLRAFGLSGRTRATARSTATWLASTDLETLLA